MTAEEAAQLKREIGALIDRYTERPRAAPRGGASAGEPDDPVVRFDPKRGYSGPSMIGRRMSQCPAKYVGALGHLYDWRAAKNREEGKTGYAAADEKMAGLCRAWRERLEGDDAQQDFGPPRDELDATF